MSAVAEASFLMHRIAEPVSAGESIKVLISRAARLAGIEPSRAKAIWYAECRRIDAEEMDRLRATAAKRAKQKEASANNDLQALRSRVSRLERLLASTDADFHRESMLALRSAMGGPDGTDSALDRPVDRD